MFYQLNHAVKNILIIAIFDYAFSKKLHAIFLVFSPNAPEFIGGVVTVFPICIFIIIVKNKNIHETYLNTHKTTVVIDKAIIKTTWFDIILNA